MADRFLTVTNHLRTWVADRKKVDALVDGSVPLAGPLVGHAAWAVEALYYLAQIDAHFTDLPLDHEYPQSAHVVDIAHARWGAGTAVTAVDLCAAALGVEHEPDSRRHWSMSMLDPSHSRNTKRRELVTHGARDWVDSVLDHSEYQLVKKQRDPLTHAWLVRNIGLNIGGPESGITRSRFPVGAEGELIAVADLVTAARDVAALHVESFFALILAAKAFRVQLRTGTTTESS